MTSFSYSGLGVPVRTPVAEAHRAAWKAIGSAGSCWTGPQRVAIAEQARTTRVQRAEPPWLRKLPEAGAGLPDAAVEAARKIAADAPKIDRAWAQTAIAALGDAAYVELAGVVICICAIDTFADALGVPYEPLPEPQPGEPDGVRNESVANVGAYVPLQDPWQGPNVARALSLVPGTNATFFGLVGSMYSETPGRGFLELVWDGPLSRPQAELLAARVAAVNECFY